MLSEDVLHTAAVLAKKHYAEAEAEEFSGDAVQDVLFPACLSARAAWLPHEELRALGFEVVPGLQGEQLLATAGIDAHVDSINGPTLFLVLHNDGLTFKQGRVAHKTRAGEWFVFTDSAYHAVRESAKSTVYLGWSVPLQKLA